MGVWYRELGEVYSMWLKVPPYEIVWVRDLLWGLELEIWGWDFGIRVRERESWWEKPRGMWGKGY